MKIVKKHHICW